MTLPHEDGYQELRDAIRDLCAHYPDAYWREVDARRGYPEDFVDALTGAGRSERPRPLGFVGDCIFRVRFGFRAGEGARSPWFHKLPQHGTPGLEIMLQAQHGQSNVARLRTRNADNANPAATWRGGDSDDSIVEVHRMFLRSYFLSDRIFTDQGMVFRRGLPAADL